MPAIALLETQPRELQDLRVELAPVVDHDHDRRTTPQRIVNRLVPRTASGDVLLLHDGIEPNMKRDPAPTVRAIKPLVLGLRERGLQAVRLDELLGLAPYATARAAAAR